ncbi:MAG TPA: hypothetical protein VGN75_16795 [Kaistia sp.]|jgi:hypothetical protein|nr:hypothetical protein [Kaistia sp.]
MMPKDDSLSLLCKRLGIPEKPSYAWPLTLADILKELVRRIEEIEKRSPPV